MPLSEEDWKEGNHAIPWVETIYTVLDDGYPEAYSSEEIAAEVVGEYDDRIVDTILVLFVLTQLEILLERGRIDAKTVGSEEGRTRTTYYRKVDE